MVDLCILINSNILVMISFLKSKNMILLILVCFISKLYCMPIPLEGKYVNTQTGEVLELNMDSTYILWHDIQEQIRNDCECNYVSKGKWQIMSSDVLQITSDEISIIDSITVEYDKRHSPDSIYFYLNFPCDYHPFEFEIYVPFLYKEGCLPDFNYHSITFNRTSLSLPRENYVFTNDFVGNYIEFDFWIDAALSNNDDLQLSLFCNCLTDKLKISDDLMRKYNYFTVQFTSFDVCLIDWKKYSREIICIKNDNELYWNGNMWYGVQKY